MKNKTELELNLLIRCDAGKEVGFGHLVRCLTIAKHLNKNYKINIIFGMINSSNASKEVINNGFLVKNLIKKKISNTDEFLWLKKIIQGHNINLILMDSRTNLSRKQLALINNNKIFITTIDDPQEKRLATDLCFYAPLITVKNLSWKEYTGKLFIGWDWIPLREQFNRLTIQRKYNNLSKTNPKIVISMGGSDPFNITEKIINAIENISFIVNLKVILGKGYQNKSKIKQSIKTSKHSIIVLTDVENMSFEMQDQDLAIISFGMTAYEVASLGIPSIHLCISNDHFLSSKTFEKNGMSINFGIFSEFKPKIFSDLVDSLLKDFKKLEEISKNCINKIDGKGVSRISEKVVQYSMEKLL